MGQPAVCGRCFRRLAKRYPAFAGDVGIDWQMIRQYACRIRPIFPCLRRKSQQLHHRPAYRSDIKQAQREFRKQMGRTNCSTT